MIRGGSMGPGTLTIATIQWEDSTDAMSTPRDLIKTLLQRTDIMAALSERPRERYELADDLDAAKSTVYKGVSQLEAHGLIERGSDGLHPTLFGGIVYQRYSHLEEAADFESLLSAIPATDAFDPVVLDGATVVMPDSHSVDRHLLHAERLERDATHIRGFTPLLSSNSVSLYRQKAVEDHADIELVLEADTVRHIASSYPTAAEEIGEQETFQLWVTNEEFPFGLFILTDDGGETHLFVEVVGADGLRGLISNNSEASLAWAEDVYERYRRAATSFDEGVFSGT